MAEIIYIKKKENKNRLSNIKKAFLYIVKRFYKYRYIKIF